MLSAKDRCDYMIDGINIFIACVLQEMAGGPSTTVCGGQRKERVVYKSVGSSVQLSIISQAEQNQFIFTYQCKL